ncbi:MAG: CRISPR-associated protein Cas5 [Candidatus Caldatribacterium sp.]|uniref:CRISPR-associated protein Cas5 n=1 Tax=Candidatus Caldatribacterium sp. TaxID=2282143 RepID=UPI0029945CCD|nr:CRISPR-associated protein Cas5 [Candidatus Caldatribacterium sp.]MCX7729834.1 CRISPR-associated protein Cas5 [Candidatus Caldatribacterium sp.]MDW8082123.1 CRISPR-associated protein Cas5 [Candidatus Calescibacterium sp.]
MDESILLQAVRIELSSYTASFRVPSFVSHQLTLPVPPLCTVFGLISAAVGRWITPRDVDWLAYRCTYEGKGTDVETIVQIEREKPGKVPLPKLPPKTVNVINREFLFLPCLTIYLPPHWAQAFYRPRFTLLLGRTQDVAYVASVGTTALAPVPSGEVGGVLLPFELLKQNNVAAWVHNLPIAFPSLLERRPLRMHLFGVVDAGFPTLLQQGGGWLVQDVQQGTVLVLYRREWMLVGT